MTEEHKIIRLKWAIENLDRNWDLVMFSDESLIIKGPAGKYRWVDTNEKDFDFNVKHPTKINVWGVISKNGPNRIHIIDGILDSLQYIEILNSNILDLMYNNPLLIFQDDNDPKHRSKNVSIYKEEYNIQSLVWPSNSPDLNPIENVWYLLKRKLHGKEYDSVENLKNNIINEWNKLDNNIINNLINSMPKRLQQVIENNGDRIDY